MQLEKYQEQILLCQALIKLDKELADKNIKPFKLNVCGGFALLLQQIRKTVDTYTDIDYIGEDLPPDVDKIIKKVGRELGYGSDWINNDVLLAGSSLKSMEYATGKLHFTTKMKLSVITVNALEKKDLLRMKMIAIDTSLCGTSLGGEFTRGKDFEDIRLLAEDLKMDIDDIEEECRPYIACPEIFTLVREYINTQDKEILANPNLFTYAKEISNTENVENTSTSDTQNFNNDPEIEDILAMEAENGGYNSSGYSLEDFYKML